MKIKINRDDNAHLEIYTNELRRKRLKNRLKELRNKRYYTNFKAIFMMFVFTFITCLLWNAPKSETNALETIKTVEKLQIKEEIKQEVKEVEGEKEIVKVLYKDIEEKAFNFIAKFEGYHDKPYWDHKQWSCGYGMTCSKNTTGITKEKSKMFVIERIRHIREIHSLYKYDDNMEVALISFIYNLGKPPVGMDRYIQNGHINALKNMMRKYVYAGDVRLRGLVKRRSAEVGLF